jgi:predicted Zn-dependent protease
MLVRRWLLFLAAMSAWAQVQEPAPGVNFYSRQKEAALGAQLVEEIRRASRPLDVPAVREYVKRIGSALATELPGAFEYTFEVLSAPGSQMSEPFALPGGYVFVPSGLFLAAGNEAEFAGMLAHSMAHAALRHGTRQASRGMIVNYASIPLIFMGGWHGIHGNDAGMAVPLGFLQFMRGHELEADALGTRAMARTGYDPAAWVSYVERTQVDKQPIERSALPPREERLAQLERTIAELPARTYAASAGEFEQVREAVRTAKGVPPRKTPTLHRQ